MFLDATSAPRALRLPEYRRVDGRTCASLTVAGTLVLVESDEEPVETARTPEPIPATLDDTADAIELDGCTVTARVNLYLRQAPRDNVLGVITAKTEVPATACTENWFQGHLRRNQRLDRCLARQH